MLELFFCYVDHVLGCLIMQLDDIFMKMPWSHLMKCFPQYVQCFTVSMLMSLTMQYEVPKQHTFCITELICDQFLCKCGTLNFCWFLTVSDYHLFGTLKWHISKKWFHRDSVVADVQWWLQSLDTIFFKEIVHMLMHW